jgi:hypothetical protein
VGEPTGSGRIRASDIERERLARFLAAAFEEGRLDVAEYDARVAAAYAAVYRDQLTELIDDLPPSDLPLFDTKPGARSPVPSPAAVPVPMPSGAVARSGRRPYGWPVVVFMFVGALFLARVGLFGPLAVMLLLAGLATVLGWISDDPHRHGRPWR